MTLEEQAFDQEIEDVTWPREMSIEEGPVGSGGAVRRQREIARGITQEQSRRMRRRKRLELKVKYEARWQRC
eukprot:Skav230433  [mRNA]  locus=scaffold1601:142514:143809:+ [translate_table: standard]